MACSSPWLSYQLEGSRQRVTDLLMSPAHVCTPAWCTEACKSNQTVTKKFPKMTTTNPLPPVCMYPLHHWVILPLLGLALCLLWSRKCSKSHVLRILRPKYKRTDSFHLLLLATPIHRTPHLRMQTPCEKSNLAMQRGHRNWGSCRQPVSTSSHENEPSWTFQPSPAPRWL